jgi:O-methyltransferase involved in polyketide biosynthesis
MVTVAETEKASLGAIQETLFIPLTGRAREATRKRPILRDPKAVELAASIDFDAAKYGRGSGGLATVLRTVIMDHWVRSFLAEHPAGTVVELGTGLNTRFERTDNGTVHWIDLDLPDTIELRRKFFTDTERRRMIAGSVLDNAWLDAVASAPGPYFFVTEGVLVYLREDDVLGTLSRIAERFPGAFVALDTYPRRALQWQHKLAARRGISARFAWSCDDPHALETLGLRLVESVSVTRPPAAVRAELPATARWLLSLANPVFGKSLVVTLFECDPHP